MGASIGDPTDDEEYGETHEINVTPFIDVMLVLLIIFMVAAPLSTVDLPIDLPTAAIAARKKPDKPIYVTIKPDLSLFLNEQPVKRQELVRTLDTIPEGGKDKRLLLRADRIVPYGELMSVLEIIRIGGYGHVSLVALEGLPGAAPAAAN